MGFREWLGPGPSSEQVGLLLADPTPAGTPGTGSTPTGGPRFDAIGPESIPPEFLGLVSYGDAATKVSRKSAIQVPAIKRGRDLIAGSLATIPMGLFTRAGDAATFTSDLLDQPETGIARSVTIARTVTDLILDGVAWWLVIETGWHGYPVRVVRLDSSVDVELQARAYKTKMGHHGTATRYADDFDLIRFDSPNDPLLVAGARAIRSAIALDQAANVYASGRQPLDYFTSADGVDPDQDDLDATMDAWEAARRQHSTGYVPAGFEYHTAGWNPDQLQLAEQRDHVSKELATLMGIPAERVNVSTTSRTYANMQQDRMAFISDTLAPYATAIAERLSMGDVTPRGTVVKWLWSEFLRTDDQSRMSIAVQGKSGGVWSAEEARTYFDPALPPVAESDLTPAPDQAAEADAATPKETADAA